MVCRTRFVNQKSLRLIISNWNLWSPKKNLLSHQIYFWKSKLIRDWLHIAWLTNVWTHTAYIYPQICCEHYPIGLDYQCISGFQVYWHFLAKIYWSLKLFNSAFVCIAPLLVERADTFENVLNFFQEKLSELIFFSTSLQLKMSVCYETEILNLFTSN